MRTALVTGGGTGIGRATAFALSEDGFHVVVAGRRPEPLADVVAEIERAGGAASAAPCDVTRADQVERLIAELDGLDVVVSNAGQIRRHVRLHETTPESFDEQMDVNLRAHYLIARAAVSRMLHGDGDRSLVFVSSSFAHTVAPGVSVYVAAKAALVGLAKALAIDYGPDGIRANAVCPAMVVTDLTYVDRPDFDNERPRFEQLYPLGRLGAPGDVAGAIRYLASPAAAWVTGQAITLDGGSTIV